MTEQQTAQRWIISVNGMGCTSVTPGQSVEIGRKPLRPLVDDGFVRMEVEDATRSMSKRHALFSVSMRGSASIRDLNSTNGSYAVMDNGELMRLSPQEEMPLPTSPFRLQLGEVPVDFIRVDSREEPDDGESESNLFAYAEGAGTPEPDAAGMSVDDILDLRAGEPTSMFQARTVAERLSDLRADSLRDFPPVGMEEGTSPLSGDALSAGRVSHSPEVPDASCARDHNVPTMGEVSLNIVRPGIQEDSQPRDLFADAQSTAERDQDSQRLDDADTSVPAQEPQIQRQDSPISQKRIQGQSADKENDASQESSMVKAPREAAEPDGEQRFDAASAHRGIRQDGQPTAQRQAATPFVPLEGTDTGVGEAFSQEADAESHGRYRQERSEEGDPSFAPAFEPGSVFERVSKGEFALRDHGVQVDGLTSQDAKSTTDFTVQFTMARHPELLPFLAMNTALYDDLYAWLAAQGNDDVDAALANNEGYAAYLKATGK